MKNTIVSHQVIVKATQEEIWALLLDKIRHPEKYIAEVLEVEIISDKDNVVHRKMRLQQGDKEKNMEELIIWNEVTGTVIFKMINDPFINGYVVNQILGIEDAMYLDFTMNCSTTNGTPLPKEQMQKTITNACEHTKQILEG
ncbi:AtaL-like protein [uncultured Polaribacter sp.]|uniref:AtaL-like protein n=1 Tax=uncultured Polaribacter sp. TaxID=174711 RepID=UPI00261673CC|nr:AtaL-like protein [uncultured Polaribacter sp.]